MSIRRCLGKASTNMARSSSSIASAASNPSLDGYFRVFSCYRRYEPCDVLPPAHDNEPLNCRNGVVGRSLESRRQNFFQHFVRDDFIGKVTNGSSSLNTS